MNDPAAQCAHQAGVFRPVIDRNRCEGKEDCVAVWGIAKLSPAAVVLSMAAMLASVLLQVRGHKLEQSQPRPFKSRFDFVRRVLAEQFFTFPRFVLTGRWYKNFAANR